MPTFGLCYHFDVQAKWRCQNISWLCSHSVYTAPTRLIPSPGIQGLAPIMPPFVGYYYKTTCLFILCYFCQTLYLHGESQEPLLLNIQSKISQPIWDRGRDGVRLELRVLELGLRMEPWWSCVCSSVGEGMETELTNRNILLKFQRASLHELSN